MTDPHPPDPRWAPPQPTYAPYQPYPPASRSLSPARTAAVVSAVVAVFVVLTVVFAVGAIVFVRATGTYGPGVAGPGRGAEAPQPGPPELNPPGWPGAAGKIPVGYEVTGTGQARVTYTVTHGNDVVEIIDATLPWRLTVEIDADFYEVRLSAMTSGAAPPGFGCILVVAGERVTDTEPDEVDSVSCRIGP